MMARVQCSTKGVGTATLVLVGAVVCVTLGFAEYPTIRWGYEYGKGDAQSIFRVAVLTDVHVGHVDAVEGRIPGT
jgi:hypothetical protein